jgi:hypothetical protein
LGVRLVLGLLLGLVLCLLLRLREEVRVGRAGCVGVSGQLATGMLLRGGGVHVLLLLLRRRESLFLFLLLLFLLRVSARNPAHHA